MNEHARGGLRLAVLVVLFVALIAPASTHARAASLLARFAAAPAPDAAAPSGAMSIGALPVDEELVTFRSRGRDVRARVYRPRGRDDAPGVVVVHGVHRLGIEEPRLVRFSRAIASSGVAVLTPQIDELAEYRVDPASIATIGDAASALADRIGRTRAGVMGMSFAGGLSLLAAADPEAGARIAFVVAVGAHDDLSRVLRFFAEDALDDPDGRRVSVRAHDYGVLVLAHTHAEDFFAAGDVDVARGALRTWLGDDHVTAREQEARLGEAGRAKLDLLFGGEHRKIAPELLAVVAKHDAEARAVSPHGRLGGVHVPVYLLHGAGDAVIPSIETLWLARDVPSRWLRSALVSQAIEHVEIGGHPGASDQWALVHFMAGVLDEAQSEPRR